jgi:hypothetical protein
MNTNPQLDLHPDAESLSAFAEHQLPEHERQPILAHLATCAQCRQILFLAQDAQSDAIEESQQSTAGPVLVPSRKQPIANWRYAWGALAACAALATVSIVFYPRHTIAPQQQVKVIAPRQIPAVPVAAPPSGEKRPGPQPPAASPPSNRAEKPAQESVMSLDAAETSAAVAKTAAQPAAKQQQAAAGASTTLNITLKPAQSSQTVEVQADAQPLAASENATVNVAAGQAPVQPETAPVTETMNAQVLQPADQVRLPTRSAKPLESAKVAPKSPPAGGASNGMGSGMAGGARGAMAGRPVASAKSPAGFAKMAPRPLTVAPEDETAAHNALGKVLPSGLAAIATAAASHHLLAIDSAGSLFLSEDAGAVWEPVSSQWSGRAILVLPPGNTADQTKGFAITGRDTANEPSQPAAAPAPPAATKPSPLFEIVTDQGVHWTSADGRIWKAK